MKSDELDDQMGMLLPRQSRPCEGLFGPGSMAAMFLGGCLSVIIFYYIVYVCLAKSRFSILRQIRSGPALDSYNFGTEAGQEMKCRDAHQSAGVEEAVTKRLASLERKATLKRAARGAEELETVSSMVPKPRIMTKPTIYRPPVV